MRALRGWRSLTVMAAAGVMVLSACAESERTSNEGEGGSGGTEGGTFTFAGSEDPVTLDPFYASDGESFRPARQIYEGLVDVKPGTADPVPGLATSWESSEDGLSTTFTLREGVKFHDGSEFNAEAVCWNFDRWYNTPPGIGQGENQAYYYAILFKGFKEGPTAKDAIYESCTVDGNTVTVKLNEPFAGFVSALTLPSFSMQSPTAIKKYGSGANPAQTQYAMSHPTGTGPFKFDEWKKGESVTLVANEDYWGQKAKVDEVIIVPLAEAADRADALMAGDVDGIDLVGPADIPVLEEEGFQVANRPAFNILYLGMNQKAKPLDDLRVRQAIAHAIDKEAVIKNSLPEGTKPASIFMPSLVNGFTTDVPTYDYDPEKAKQLLKEAGAENLTLTFHYPTDISRPYMPSPVSTFNVIRSQLQAVGIKVQGAPMQWTQYTDHIQGTTDHGIHLLGWTGDYNDPDNFLGVFFGTPTVEWGFDNKPLFDALREARGIPSVAEQKPLYEDINREIMEFLPGVPIASPVPSVGWLPTSRDSSRAPSAQRHGTASASSDAVIVAGHR